MNKANRTDGGAGVLSELETQGYELLRQLTEAGHEAVIVGGYVRDQFLGKKVNDLDIATSAKPEEVMALFSHTVPTGLQHGTVTVIQSPFTFEVTTYRKESHYEQFRRPGRVEYVSDLHEDLQRRDFTMNAMAMDLDGQLIDPFHGSKDLEAGKLRCVGEAPVRFQEDALRMLRCIRFAATYDLSIVDETWQGLLQYRQLLVHIAMERVRAELDKMIEGDHPEIALKLLQQSDLLNHLKVPINLNALFNGLPTQVEWMKLDSPLLRWAYIGISSQLPIEELQFIFKSLTFSNEKLKHILTIVKFHQWLLSVEIYAERWIIGALQFSPVIVLHWIQIAELDDFRVLNSRDQGITFESILSEGKRAAEQLSVASIKDLAIKGSDLLSLNPQGGPWMSSVLHALLEDVALGKVINTKEALLQKAVSYRKRLHYE